VERVTLTVALAGAVVPEPVVSFASTARAWGPFEPMEWPLSTAETVVPALFTVATVAPDAVSYTRYDRDAASARLAGALHVSLTSLVRGTAAQVGVPAAARRYTDWVTAVAVADVVQLVPTAPVTANLAVTLCPCNAAFETPSTCVETHTTTDAPGASVRAEAGSAGAVLARVVTTAPDGAVAPHVPVHRRSVVFWASVACPVTVFVRLYDSGAPPVFRIVNWPAAAVDVVPA
jgi:hypothetical protein